MNKFQTLLAAIKTNAQGKFTMHDITKITNGHVAYATVESYLYRLVKNKHLNKVKDIYEVVTPLDSFHKIKVVLGRTPEQQRKYRAKKTKRSSKTAKSSPQLNFGLDYTVMLTHPNPNGVEVKKFKSQISVLKELGFVVEEG